MCASRRAKLEKGAPRLDLRGVNILARREREAAAGRPEGRPSFHELWPQGEGKRAQPYFITLERPKAYAATGSLFAEGSRKT
jgi:hypothetical protein